MSFLSLRRHQQEFDKLRDKFGLSKSQDNPVVLTDFWYQYQANFLLNGKIIPALDAKIQEYLDNSQTRFISEFSIQIYILGSGKVYLNTDNDFLYFGNEENNRLIFKFEPSKDSVSPMTVEMLYDYIINATKDTDISAAIFDFEGMSCLEFSIEF